MIKENQFQKKIINMIKDRLGSDCIILKNDPNYIQGIPDIIILYKNCWAALEIKADKKSKKRPNQDYYVIKMNNMSFASFIYPDNVNEVLYEMERSFGIKR